MPLDEPGDWAILSRDDDAYLTVQRPVETFLKAYPVRLIPEGWPYEHVAEYETVLELPRPLQAGATYQFSSLTADVGFDYTHDPENNFSPALKVNQVGYLPEVIGRYGYIGYWLGRVGPMDLDQESRRFRVVNSENGAVVYSGAVELRMTADQGTEDAYGSNYSQATIYDVNLFELIQVGTFHVVWEGVGRSWDFEVSDSVYDSAFVTAFKALYHQRCGTALVAEHTPYTHEECHVRPVILSEYDMFSGEDHFAELPAQALDEAIEVHGGYHDAADYDRRIQHMDVADMLLDLYELNPEKYSRDDLGIPESGNGIPDVIDEAMWGVDFFRRLQQDDGGVRSGVETTQHPDGWELGPAEDTMTTWYAFAASYQASYRYAGTAAKLARALNSWDQNLARTFLGSATDAWSWAEANRPEEDGIEWDALAAAELFKTTGQSSYNTAFIEYMPFEEDDLVFSIARFEPDVLMPAMLSYATADNASAAHKDAIMTVLTSQRATGWRSRGHCTDWSNIHMPQLPSARIPPCVRRVLFCLYELLQDDRFLEWGIYTCDMTLGANPAGRSWVTGVGDNPVQGVMHLPSMADDIEPPCLALRSMAPAPATGVLPGKASLRPHVRVFIRHMMPGHLVNATQTSSMCGA